MTKPKQKPKASKRSSARVAKIAGRLMRQYEMACRRTENIHPMLHCSRVTDFDCVEWIDVITLAASVLSQTEPTKAKAKVRK